MKRIFLLISFALIFSAAFAQDSTGYKFTDLKRLPATSVKDQYASGTCWSFSGVSFIESEIARMGTKIENVPDISEMFIVRKCYEAKAEKYVRMHGMINFGGGGSFFDNFWTYKTYGFVPESAYSGLNYGTKKHNHDELDKVLKAYVDVLKDQTTLTTAWLNGFKGILDAYLGPAPQNFTYNGKSYTPRTFADQVVKINPDDYVSITSYTHHPFWTKFALEIPDNWIWSESYNVPMTDMVSIVDNAINNGYTIAWGADVSESYFSYTDGIAIVPDLLLTDLVKTERSKWDKTTRTKFHLDKPGKEATITQEMRQAAFDTYRTTDDHGMQIVGIAKDQNGTEYYIVKNSWNTDNIYNGYLYVSKAYFMFKTMNFMVHKNALPDDLKKKLNIN